MSFLAPFYPWLKALHVIAVISWMAALLYMPRLFVYHTRAAPGSEMSETFKVMEERLGNVIMKPAMVVSLLMGLAMLAVPGVWAGASGWLWTKLALVAALLGAHAAMLRWRADFAADRNQRPERFFRVANEVPTLLMIGIVILVIVRPF